MAFRQFVLGALMLPFVYTQTIGGEGNLTIAFHADNDESACQDDPLSGLVMTTSTIPTGFTCFNVSDLFSKDNGTGFQNATQTYYHISNGTIIQPNGIHWLLDNRQDFDSNANYSRVSYNQVNVSEAEPGKDGTWVFYVYAFDDCRQISTDRNVDKEDFPWFETSCQTESDGQCQTLPYPIKSFGIAPASGYNEVRDGCNEWAYMGAANQLGNYKLGLAILASVAGLFLIT